jgi:hypothetical protein
LYWEVDRCKCREIAKGARKMSNQWKCGPEGPKTVEELRAAMKAKIKGKTGKALIDKKFTKDHIYAGHKGDIVKLARDLAGMRNVSQSTLLISSLDQKAYEEVYNWIQNIDGKNLTLSHDTWTISNRNSVVLMKNSYDFLTVEKEKLKGMDRDDKVKKSRKYAKPTHRKTPKLACQFADDGTPQIYHLDY